MADQNRMKALNAVQSFLLPLASFILKCGLSWREFSVLSKLAFVKAATDDYGINGRPTNVSRVSLLTGIARKEVKRQRALLNDHEMSIAGLRSKTTDATSVLSGWYQDAEFLSTDGEPALLNETSFGQLCSRYGGDVPATTMLKELKRVGAVAEHAGKRYEVVSRYYMPAQSDAEWALTAGDYLADISNTINYNMAVDPDDRTRFLGRATAPLIAKHSVPEFHEFVEEHGQRFLEAVDAWLAANHVADLQANNIETVRLGVGLFMIQDDKPNTTDTADVKQHREEQG